MIELVFCLLVITLTLGGALFYAKRVIFRDRIRLDLEIEQDFLVDFPIKQISWKKINS